MTDGRAYGAPICTHQVCKTVSATIPDHTLPRTVSRLAQALVNALPQQCGSFLADAGIKRTVHAVLAVQMRRLQAAADKAFAHVSCCPSFCLITALRDTQLGTFSSSA